MPFLILPRSPALAGGLRERLAARLCPYAGPLRTLLETPSHAVLGTSLARRDPDGRVRPALPRGTSAFEIAPEGDALRVSTDPLGTCPVWYARAPGGWCVAPEAKALALLTPLELRPDPELQARGPRPAGWSPFRGAERLVQGASLVLRGEPRVEGGARAFDVAADGPPGSDWPAELGRVLAAAFPDDPAPAAALVSGGIDSSIACALARRRGPVRTFSLGTRHGDEFAPAAELARALGCVHAEVHLDEAGALELFDRAVFENEVFDGLTAEILVQLAALHEAASAECRRVVTGYGSDLLFDGMLHVPVYMQAVGLSTTPELMERTRWTGELAPFCAWSRGLSPLHVFWDPAVIDAALRVPRALCRAGGVEKRVLREAAVRAGLLPADLAFKPKLGLSEGTGANRLLCTALGIEGPHGYGEKSRACSARLRRVLAPAS
jgi:asparagine synthetase B (glutamine-hydrolysing)